MSRGNAPCPAASRTGGASPSSTGTVYVRAMRRDEIDAISYTLFEIRPLADSSIPNFKFRIFSNSDMAGGFSAGGIARFDFDFDFDFDFQFF